jgi:hypothetical protein
LTLVAHTDERILVLNHLLDAEALSRVVIQGFFDFTIVCAKQDLALVCTHKDFASFKPAMSSVIL